MPPTLTVEAPLSAQETAQWLGRVKPDPRAEK